MHHITIIIICLISTIRTPCHENTRRLSPNERTVSTDRMKYGRAHTCLLDSSIDAAGKRHCPPLTRKQSTMDALRHLSENARSKFYYLQARQRKERKIKPLNVKFYEGVGMVIVILL